MYYVYWKRTCEQKWDLLLKNEIIHQKRKIEKSNSTGIIYSIFPFAFFLYRLLFNLFFTICTYMHIMYSKLLMWRYCEIVYYLYIEIIYSYITCEYNICPVIHCGCAVNIWWCQYSFILLATGKLKQIQDL